VAGAFMLRDGPYKYMHYVAIARSSTILRAIRGARRRRRGSGVRGRAGALPRRCFAMLDPDEVDARAKRRQATLLARFGGARRRWRAATWASRRRRARRPRSIDQDTRGGDPDDCTYRNARQPNHRIGAALLVRRRAGRAAP
jgi:hypothetical protein